MIPEVTALHDRRGERPPEAAGAAEFWYDPEIWALPGLSSAARVLYTGLCSHLGHGEINRKDLRNTLKESTDEEINETLAELTRQNLLEPIRDGFAVYPVEKPDPSGEDATP